MPNIDRSKCCDCGSPEVAVHWVLPGSRCQPCSDIKKKEIQAKRQAEYEAERARLLAHVCGDSDDSCEECCEHGDTDEHGCLDCGKDMSEEFACRAEAAADAANDR